MLSKIPTSEFTQRCNAQKNPENSKILASTARPGADSLRKLEFLSITVVREFQGCEKLIF